MELQSTNLMRQTLRIHNSSPALPSVDGTCAKESTSDSGSGLVERGERDTAIDQFSGEIARRAALAMLVASRLGCCGIGGTGGPGAV